MADGLYARLSQDGCSGSLFVSLIAPKKPGRGGKRPGAGRPKGTGAPKATGRIERACQDCGALYSATAKRFRCAACVERLKCVKKRRGCAHPKPIFSNGKERKVCFECAPKPEAKLRKAYAPKTTRTATCLNEACGAAFNGPTRQRYCGSKCKTTANNLLHQMLAVDRSPRACRCCGVMFTPAYGMKNKLQCSPECLEKFHASRAQKRIEQRMQADPVLKLARRMRTFVCQAIQRGGFSKSGRTEKILGCSWEFFRKHIDKQFGPGMTWENRAEWHIDHIVPMSRAATVDDAIALNHFTNLRPMWAADNLSKGARLTHLI